MKKCNSVSDGKSISYEQILSYCLFYRGEAQVPQQYDQRNEGQLWQAEKMICKEFRDMVGDVNPRKDIAGLVVSYISKWNPYGLESVMKTYFEKINDPEIIDFVIKVYC